MIPGIEAHFEDVTRLRAAAGSYDFANGGRWTGAGTDAAVIRASVQPASEKDLLRLPEGLRTRDMVTILTDDELRTANETAQTEADRIEHQGEQYEVVAVERFEMGQLNHYDCVARRVDRQGAA